MVAPSDDESAVLAALERAEAHQARSGRAAALCRPDITGLCLLGRFVVAAVWKNPFDGSSGNAGAIQLTDSSGYMWWLSPLVMEVPLKLLNFCGTNPPVFKVFAAGLSDFQVGLGVQDQVTGNVVIYTNPGGHVFNTIIDQAPPFPCL
jgi:hypothetical protein